VETRRGVGFLLDALDLFTAGGCQPPWGSGPAVRASYSGAGGDLLTMTQASTNASKIPKRGPETCKGTPPIREEA